MKRLDMPALVASLLGSVSPVYVNNSFTAMHTAWVTATWLRLSKELKKEQTDTRTEKLGWVAMHPLVERHQLCSNSELPHVFDG